MRSRRKKERLDVLLVERGLAEDLKKAQAMILAGQVRVRESIKGDRETGKSSRRSPDFFKPGTTVLHDSGIEILGLPRFVSRGGEKLQSALDHWGLFARDRVCLDVGVSTGGFTDCLLKNGAERIYGVDVGYGQLDPSLRSDPRVVIFEKTHILKWTPPWHDGRDCRPSLATIDLSFISLKNILKKICEFSRGDLEILALIKPQFEVPPKYLRKGIVIDEEKRSAAVRGILAFAKEIGLDVLGHFPCPVTGRMGNREEWAYLRYKE